MTAEFGYRFETFVLPLLPVPLLIEPPRAAALGSTGNEAVTGTAARKGSSC
jgi:hypothetical protein